MTPPNVRETEPERRARIRGNLQRLMAAGAPDERIAAYLETERITPEMEAARTPQTGMERAAGAVQAFNQGTTFNFGDEIAGFGGAVVDKVRNPSQPFGALLDQNIQSQRDNLQTFRDENPKTALGLELGGGLVSGIATGGAAAAGRTGLSAAARVAASGAGGGALAGVGSGEGTTDRLTRGAVGAAAGGALGWGLGRLATSRVGDAVARGSDDLITALSQAADGPVAAPAVSRAPVASAAPRVAKLAEMDGATQGAVRSIAARTGGADAVPQAKSLLEELDRAGLMEDVIAADVLPSGGRELQRAFNVSPQAAAPGRTQLLERGARVGQRSRDALTQATGLAPQTTRAGVDDLVAERAAKAAPVYAEAAAEGAANRMTPVTPQLNTFLNEPDIQQVAKELLQMQQFRGKQASDPEVLDAIYKVLSDRQGTLRTAQLANPRNMGRFEGENLTRLKSQGLDAIAGDGGPMPSYRPAVTQFADDSRLKGAYERGIEMFNKPVGDIRAEMAQMTADEVELFKRGAFDALLERRVGPASPNADLGEFARQSKLAGQATVNTEPAAERLRTVFGEDAYQQVLGAARGEGRFTQTANDALQNSSTARQLADMGAFGQMAQEAVTGNPASPGWLMRQGGNVMDATRRAFDEPASRRAAELLLDKPQTLLELLDQLGQSDAARRAAVQPIAGQAVRAGNSRMP